MHLETIAERGSASFGEDNGESFTVDGHPSERDWQSWDPPSESDASDWDQDPDSSAA